MTAKKEDLIEGAVEKGHKSMGALGISGIGATVLVLVIVLAQMSGGIKLLGDWTAQYEQSAKDELAHENAHKRLDAATRQAIEFVECWPWQTCQGIPQLPVDVEQNEAIEKLLTTVDRLQRFDREHCQWHRDNGNKVHDCSGL